MLEIISLSWSKQCSHSGLKIMISTSFLRPKSSRVNEVLSSAFIIVNCGINGNCRNGAGMLSFWAKPRKIIIMNKNVSVGFIFQFTFFPSCLRLFVVQISLFEPRGFYRQKSTLRKIGLKPLLSL